MNIFLTVSEENQYGYIPPQLARSGVMFRATVEYIKRILFSGSDQNNKENINDYEKALTKFGVLFESANSSSGKKFDSFKNDVFLEFTKKNKNITNQKKPASALNEMFFCIAVQGLCLVMANVNFEHYYSTVGDDENAGNDEDDWATSKDEELDLDVDQLDDDKRRAEYNQIVYAIKDLLLRALPRDWEKAKTTEASEPRVSEIDSALEKQLYLLLFSRMILDALLESIPERIVKQKMAAVEPDDGWSRYFIVLVDTAMAEKIDAFLRELPYQYTLQPLKAPVAYSVVKAESALENTEGEFHLDLITLGKINRFLYRFYSGFSKVCRGKDAHIHSYITAINFQQSVPWRLNLDLLDWVSQMIDLANQPKKSIAPDQQDLYEWITTKLYRPRKSETRKSYQLPAEFLDHILMRRVLDELCGCDESGRQAVFYLPWKADYRGRIYAETPWLSPQGGDLQRALLEFANGKSLDETGIKALKRHGANLIKRECIINDLGIKDRQVITLEEREKWIEKNEVQIQASAESPLETDFWCKVASKPMQFLAFCLAYHQWKNNPEAPIHLPVQIDGTCNGLQHIAALTCNEDLARAVNVLPKANNLPGDIYTELAEIAVTTLGNLRASCTEMNLPKQHEEAILMADDWLKNIADKQEWLNRSTAKKVVMTIPYGAGTESQAAHVLDAIIDKIEAIDLEKSPAEAIDKWIDEQDTEEKFPRSAFRKKCCKGHFKALRKKAYGGNEAAKTHWNRLRSLAAYTSLAIVCHLRHALSNKYPCVDTFSGWLKKIANASHLPLLWSSPLGFPVCQNKFKLSGSSRSIKLEADREIRLDFQMLKEEISNNEQKSALLPNLIHSLDATHLALTMLGAKRQHIKNIGSIHDCLLCHPNDAEQIGQILRQQFAAMYERKSGGQGLPKALQDWQNWMHQLMVIKLLDNCNLVLGALEHPNGYGENMLRAQQEKNDKKAEKDLLFLKETRQMNHSQRYMMCILLRYAEEQALTAPKKKTDEFPKLDTGALRIEAGNISSYFFS
ncbi:DNA-dependent RNA polymerase [Nitrosomonas sp. Nm51]|uniref:DNA-directed RNA polymerase n=1 Tax=Nitrosomonas sp. Nm51 TaxID=133720 RepID=UPI0008C53BBA|nr:DNA-directed RNA polymerase [Nitrosomonas sp. Nm51]SER77490.1 DNA-dependent RNA polymerase [Nitrosomonas sp. Nm51]